MIRCYLKQRPFGNKWLKINSNINKMEEIELIGHRLRNYIEPVLKEAEEGEG